MSTDVQPLPFVVVRRALGDPGPLEALAPIVWREALAELARSHQQVDHTVAVATDALHEAIGHEPPGSRRARLVALRRALHNRRSSQANLLREELSPGLPASVGQAVEALQAWVLQSARAEALADEVIVEANALLQTAAGDASLREAIEVASPSLGVRLNGEPRWSHQLRQSVLNYLTRSVTKASPFGFFVEVAAVMAVKGAGEQAALRGERRYWCPLPGEPACSRDDEPFRPNPTLTFHEGQVSFVRHRQGREEVCSLPAARLLEAGWPDRLDLHDRRLLRAGGMLEGESPALAPAAMPWTREQALAHVRAAAEQRSALHVDAIRDGVGEVSAERVGTACDALHELCVMLSPADALAPLRRRVLTLWREEFGREAVPLLVFYRAFAGSTARHDAWVPSPPDLARPRQKPDGIWLEEQKCAQPRHRRSFSSFVLPVQHEGRSFLAVSRLHEGHGRMASRLAAMLPPAYLKALRLHNAQLSGTTRLAELRDGSRFAANHHAPLLPWALMLPGSDSTLATSQLLPSSLWVTESEGEPALVDEQGRRVAPMDLGLQSGGRGAFFEFLLAFSDARDVSLEWLLERVDQLIPPTQVAGGVMRHERVWSHDGGLLLRRRTWRVRRGAVTVRSGSALARRCLQLETWRRSLALPETCFATLVGSPAARSHPSAHKPFFLRWSSPLHIELLDHALDTRRDADLLLVESVPGLEGSAVAEEWLLQWEGPA